MNIAGKHIRIILGIVCLPLTATAQPGFAPGGASHGRGGPGGPPPGYGHSGGPASAMENSRFTGGSGGRPGPSGPSDQHRPGMPPPSMGFRGTYPNQQSAPTGIPSTRFGSIPNHSESSAQPGMRGLPPGEMSRRGAVPGSPAPADVSRMQQALRQRDYATIGKESEGIRNRTERIQRMGSDLPVQDRIQIPLINHMYRQGADLMEEGRSTRDDAKIRMGIQQIDQANEKLDRLQERPSSRPGENGRR